MKRTLLIRNRNTLWNEFFHVDLVLDACQGWQPFRCHNSGVKIMIVFFYTSMVGHILLFHSSSRQALAIHILTMLRAGQTGFL